MRAMSPQASPPKYTSRQFNQSPDSLKAGRGYGVVYSQTQGQAQNSQASAELSGILKSISRDMPSIWVANEATRGSIQANQLSVDASPSQSARSPVVPYFKSMGSIGTAACVSSDSSAVQEEATISGVPCSTSHNYAERRITVEQGTNIAVGRNSSLIHRAVAEI
ncbi:hypothetical protein OY671_010845, partial [Metschnikowia pulcherrima]